MGFSITRARAVPTFVVLALLALGGCLLVQPSTIAKDDHQMFFHISLQKFKSKLHEAVAEATTAGPRFVSADDAASGATGGERGAGRGGDRSGQLVVRGGGGGGQNRGPRVRGAKADDPYPSAENDPQIHFKGYCDAHGPPRPRHKILILSANSNKATSRSLYKQGSTDAEWRAHGAAAAAPSPNTNSKGQRCGSHSDPGSADDASAAVVGFGQVLLNRHCYAAAHGYDVAFDFTDYTKGRTMPLGESQTVGDMPPHWNKVLSLLRHLPNYDWVLAIDADAMFTGLEISLEDVIENHTRGSETHMVGCESGGTLWRNSDIGRGAAQLWYDLGTQPGCRYRSKWKHGKSSFDMNLDMPWQFLATAVAGGANGSLYGNFDIILDHFSRISQLQPTPHALWAVFYLVPRLTSCRLVLAIRCYVQFGASGIHRATRAPTTLTPGVTGHHCPESASPTGYSVR